jgi:hypothetical protein
VKLAPPVVYVTVNVSPAVGWAVPEPLVWAANFHPVPAPSVEPDASPNWYVIVDAVLELLCVIELPTVLN